MASGNQIFGGNENLEAISFLKEFNATVYSHFPDVQTIAEESTSFSGVSRPVYTGGLGFGMKWMMGWMHDTINYFSEDPINRRYHHNQFTFSLIYAFTENFMLPFRMMKWYTVKALCCGKCRAMSGSNLPTCV
jgi:1,4-alpha-glucan branching enzyme